MRALTDAEARLIRALVARPAEGEHELLEETRLPRSTYHAVRRRAYEEGWLRVRFVPHPGCFGFGAITVAVARPYADRATPLMERWSRLDSNVVLWASSQLLFGIFLHRSGAEAARTAAGLNDDPTRPGAFVLSTGTTPEAVPLYFDYEGVWSHLAGLSGITAYPRPLAPPFPPGARTPTGDASPGLRRAAHDLVLRPIVAELEGRSGHYLGLLGLTRPERRLLSDGWVLHRALPDFAVLPAYRDRRADQVVFLHGEFIPPARPAELLRALTERCQVYPFLFAHDGRRAILGTVGQAEPPSGGNGPRASVLGTIEEHLRQIEVESDRIASLARVVDHRYDRLLEPTRAPARGRA